jgi:hypothetical protein
MPYHTVTASALMTSMLSLSNRNYAWLSEGTINQIIRCFLKIQCVIMQFRLFWFSSIVDCAQTKMNYLELVS